MRGSSKKKINKLISDIGNRGLSIKAREKSLAALEKLVKGELGNNSQKFEAALQKIGEKLSAIEDQYNLVVGAAAPSVDNDAVDKLYSNVRDQVNQENSRDAKLMAGIKALRGTIPSAEQLNRDFERVFGRTVGSPASAPSSPSPKQNQAVNMQPVNNPDLDGLLNDPERGQHLDELLAPEPQEELHDDPNRGQHLDELLAPERQEELHDDPERGQHLDALLALEETPAPEEAPVMMSSLPDTQIHQQFEEINPPSRVPELDEQPQATLSIQEQIDKITKGFTPQEKQVLTSMSSGKNENYTLHVATLIQQRDKISEKGQEADRKLENNAPLKDEDIAAKLQAEELNDIFKPNNS